MYNCFHFISFIYTMLFNMRYHIYTMSYLYDVIFLRCHIYTISYLNDVIFILCHIDLHNLALQNHILLYTRWPKKHRNSRYIRFSGLRSDQQLFFTLLDRALFPHYNNTNIIKFG